MGTLIFLVTHIFNGGGGESPFVSIETLLSNVLRVCKTIIKQYISMTFLSFYCLIVTMF